MNALVQIGAGFAGLPVVAARRIDALILLEALALFHSSPPEAELENSNLGCSH